MLKLDLSHGFARRLRLAPLTALLLVLAACSVNPATGKRQVALIGEQQEIEIGREQDKAIVAQLGLYGGPELQAYVQRIGAGLAAESERPELPWTFRVVDDPGVNAFALPGGFIYVTRGIMTHLTNEAELAAVLGHEIGHVTARHGVNQLSKAQLANLGLGIGSILSEDVAKLGGAAQAGLSLLFLKYSRDDERQADDLGVRYAMRENYDPREMSSVFELLDRVGQASDDGGSVPGWLSTHPAPENRKQAIDESLAAMKADFSDAIVRQDDYYREIDDMVFGQDPREGYFRGNQFLHPEMRFTLAFPESFRTMNQKAAVVGMSEGNDAAIEISLAQAESARAGLEGFLAQEGIAPAEGGVEQVAGGLPLASSGFAARTGNAEVRGVVAFVDYEGRVFRLVGYGTSTGWSGNAGGIHRALGSFGPLTDPEALEVEPQRVEIVAPDRPLTLDEFARSFGASVDLETLALINQLDTRSTLEAGRPYKIVRDGEGGEG